MSRSKYPTTHPQLPTDRQLIEWSASRLAASYRAYYRWVQSQPLATRWQYGAYLNKLKAAWRIAREAEGLGLR